MDTDLIRLLHALGANVGLSALLLFAFNSIEQRSRTLLRGAQPVLVGVAFGLTAVLALSVPLRLAPGLIAHIGPVIVALGGLFGGWPVALIAGALGAGYRLWLGGLGASAGATSLAAAAAVGVAVRLLVLRGRPVGYTALAWLSAALVLVTSGSFLLLPDPTGWTALRAVGLPLALVNAASTMALGAMLLEGQRRREVAASLAASEERFQTLAEQLPGIVFRRRQKPDGAWSLDYLSRGGAAFAEAPLEEIQRDPRVLMQMVHPEDKGTVAQMFNQAPDTPTRVFDYRVLYPSGRMQWVQGQSAVSRQPNGDLVFDGILLDATQPKLQELALRESEARYRLLAENSSDQIVRVGADGTVLFSSPASMNLIGYRAEERMGRPALELVHADDQARCREAIAQARQRGLETSVTYRIRHKDGHWLWAEANIRPVGDAAAPGGRELVVVIRNIDRRVQIEEQLRQAQRMEAIGQLTGGVAHQFNNLMMIISGSLEFLRDRVRGSEELETAVQIALRGVERGAGLTQQLLSFSRNQPLRPRTVDMNLILGETASLARAALPKTIAFEFQPRADLPAAVADDNQLQNAALNLVVNARDALPEGGWIRLSTGAGQLSAAEAQALGLPPGPYVRMIVQDNGTGMAPDVLAKAVEPFFTTKPVGKGTGLGLSMVHGFAEQSGGRLLITSQPGRGTTVEVWLPASAEAAAPAAGPAPAPAARPGELRTILLTEDDPDVLATTSRMLRELGYRVLEAPDGPAALLELERNGAADLLLTDIVLPHGMSGPDLAREALARRPGLRVVYMTGYAPQALPDHAAAASGIPLLWKPFGKEELDRTLNLAWGTGAESPHPLREAGPA